MIGGTAAPQAATSATSLATAARRFGMRCSRELKLRLTCHACWRVIPRCGPRRSALDRAALATSMRGDIGIAQDVVLQLQIVQAKFDDIADADDACKLSVAQNRHVAHPMAGHQAHHVSETVSVGETVITPRRMISLTGIDVALAIARNGMNDFTFGNETENGVATR